MNASGPPMISVTSGRRTISMKKEIACRNIKDISIKRVHITPDFVDVISCVLVIFSANIVFLDNRISLSLSKNEAKFQYFPSTISSYILSLIAVIESGPSFSLKSYKTSSTP